MNALAKGTTLPELLVSLAVAGVLLGVALPSFHQLVADQRRIATINALVGSLNLARVSAVKSMRTTTVCASGDGVHCGDDWSAGWMVFTEPRGWRPTDPVPMEERVDFHQAGPRGVAVMANRARFRFQPGRQRSTNGTLAACQAGRGSALVVAPTGRVRSEPGLPDWAIAACRG